MSYALQAVKAFAHAVDNSTDPYLIHMAMSWRAAAVARLHGMGGPCSHWRQASSVFREHAIFWGEYLSTMRYQARKYPVRDPLRQTYVEASLLYLQSLGMCLNVIGLTFQIGLKRLRARPWAKYCIEYARTLERSRPRRVAG